jgi:hypothetical protein
MNEEKLGEMVECERHGLVLAPSADAHAAADNRSAVVARIALEMNERGINFQPGQTWTAKHKATRRAARRRS